MLHMGGLGISVTSGRVEGGRVISLRVEGVPGLPVVAVCQSGLPGGSPGGACS